MNTKFTLNFKCVFAQSLCDAPFYWLMILNYRPLSRIHELPINSNAMQCVHALREESENRSNSRSIKFNKMYYCTPKKHTNKHSENHAHAHRFIERQKRAHTQHSTVAAEAVAVAIDAVIAESINFNWIKLTKKKWNEWALGLFLWLVFPRHIHKCQFVCTLNMKANIQAYMAAAASVWLPNETKMKSKRPTTMTTNEYGVAFRFYFPILHHIMFTLFSIHCFTFCIASVGCFFFIHSLSQRQHCTLKLRAAQQRHNNRKQFKEKQKHRFCGTKVSV